MITPQLSTFGDRICNILNLHHGETATYRIYTYPNYTKNPIQTTRLAHPIRMPDSHARRTDTTRIADVEAPFAKLIWSPGVRTENKPPIVTSILETPPAANIGTFLHGIWCSCNELCLWCNIWLQFRPNPLTKLISFRMFVRTSSRMLHELPRAGLYRLAGEQPNPSTSLQFARCTMNPGQPLMLPGKLLQSFRDPKQLWGYVWGASRISFPHACCSRSW